MKQERNFYMEKLKLYNEINKLYCSHAHTIETIEKLEKLELKLLRLITEDLGRR